jgi:uncharacterized membrane protein
MIDIVPNWHPVFVHFTVALLPMAALLYAAAAAAPGGRWSVHLLSAARINLWLGVLLSLVTVVAGFIAMTHAVHTDAQLAVVQIHRRAALVTAVFWWVLALWDVRSARKGLRPPLVFVLLALAALAPLSGTGWLGAELVYRHGVGVQHVANSP